MFNITLLMNLVSWGLLTILASAAGLYCAHPEYLADNTSIATDADKLFPRFIAVGLPVGMSGLVVAGLLAAAMSSLSSGINSSCAVISIDYVGRWRNAERSEPRLRDAVDFLGGRCCGGSSEHGGGIRAGQSARGGLPSWQSISSPSVCVIFTGAVCEAGDVSSYLDRCARLDYRGSVGGLWTIDRQGVGRLKPLCGSLAETIDRIATMGVLWIMPLSLLTGIVIGYLGSMLGLGRPAPPLPSAE